MRHEALCAVCFMIVLNIIYIRNVRFRAMSSEEQKKYIVNVPFRPIDWHKELTTISAKNSIQNECEYSFVSSFSPASFEKYIYTKVYIYIYV